MKARFYINGLVVCFLLIFGCKKIPDGNLSPLVRYEVLPIVIQQGRVFVSTAINPEGSTKPMKFTLINVYNRETGEDVTSIFMEKYHFKVWTGLYDSKLDTTLELINAKRIDSMIYPIQINSASGQLEANYTTFNLPAGKYSFDLKAENQAGERIFKNIGEFDLIAADFYEVPTTRSTVAVKVGAENRTKSIPSNRQHIRVRRVNDKEDKVIVRFLDKNGAVFNPKNGEVIRRPNSGIGGGYLRTMRDYSVSYGEYDDRMEFIYGIVPFPLDVNDDDYNYFYRIPSQYILFDESLSLPYDTYSCNVRFSFQAFAPGTYEIDVIIPQATRVP